MGFFGYFWEFGVMTKKTRSYTKTDRPT